MTDQENKKSNKGDGSFGEAVGNLLEEVAQSIESVISTVVETVETVVEEVIGVESKVETKDKNENIESSSNLPKDAAHLKDLAKDAPEFSEAQTEHRIGYALVLPQVDEVEEETVIVEADDKDEIEAAIAKSRPTGEESTAQTDELVAETLPSLPKVNRMRLQVQSPNRIFLYWNLASDPFETLYKAFGNRAANYTLVTKLINLSTNAESFAPANLQGDWWYNVRSNSTYRIDLGFYAMNRPFIRLFSSNVVSTPRVAPSLRIDTSADWAVARQEFLQVLEVSGFANNNLRFDFAATATINKNNEEQAVILVAQRLAPNQLILENDLDLAELKWLFVTLAANHSYDDLRESLSDEIIAWLETVLEKNPEALLSANIRRVLESIFGSEFVALFTQETERQNLMPTVFGASSIYFPEILFPKLRFPELQSARQNAFDIFSAENDFTEDLWPLSSAEFIK